MEKDKKREEESNPIVCVVDDEPQLTELYTTWLSDQYTVRAATSGREALDKIDETVAVVLLDRQIPGLSGPAVLEEIRDRGLDCKVAIVTSIEPDFDIIELGFDAYLVKPVDADDIREIVQTLIRRSDYQEQVQELFALTSKKATLEASLSDEALAASEEYQQLVSECDELASDIAQSSAELDSEDFDRLFRELGTAPAKSNQ